MSRSTTARRRHGAAAPRSHCRKEVRPLGVAFAALWWLGRGAITPFNVVVGWRAGANLAPALFNLIRRVIAPRP